jgi:hypothetical protein
VIGKIKKGIGWDDSAKSFRSWDNVDGAPQLIW